MSKRAWWVLAFFLAYFAFRIVLEFASPQAVIASLGGLVMANHLFGD